MQAVCVAQGCKKWKCGKQTQHLLWFAVEMVVRGCVQCADEQSLVVVVVVVVLVLVLAVPLTPPLPEDASNESTSSSSSSKLKMSAT